MKGAGSESDQDQRWMQLALKMAARAADCGEVPVGAVAVHQGRLLAAVHNRSIELSDPTAHAEILALREAGRELGNYRLTDLEIYVTLEPCAMCAGALLWARISRLVYGAPDVKAGAVVSRAHLLEPGRFNHSVSISGGILAESSAQLLKDFFQARR